MVDVFDALADPKRREILELVANKPLTTAQLNKTLKLTAPVIDKHLKMLVKTELLSVEVKGKTSTYSLNRTGLAQAAKWFGKFGASFISGQADQIGENLSNLLSSAASWLETKVGSKINLDFDPEEVGREIGKKLSDVKKEATDKVVGAKAKVAKK
ncbi:MAG: ArsR family transcriptional regulator [Burkholderiaceae bacterium]|nr:ArsR family transcriptional regulator [Burkholderiaceae bacterium]